MTKIPDDIRAKINEELWNYIDPVDKRMAERNILFGYLLSVDKGMRWVKASERLPIYEPNRDYNLKRGEKALHGYYNGSGLFITHEGHFHINDIEWLDESDQSVDKDKEIAEGRKEIERLKGLIAKAHDLGWKRDAKTYTKFKSENNL